MVALYGMAPFWKKVYHDYAVFAVHNQTAAFLYKLRQPCDLGDMARVEATGQGVLQVSDHAMLLNGTPNFWTWECGRTGPLGTAGPHMPSHGAWRAPAAAPSRSTAQGTSRQPHGRYGADGQRAMPRGRGGGPNMPYGGDSAPTVSVKGARQQRRQPVRL